MSNRLILGLVDGIDGLFLVLDRWLLLGLRDWLVRFLVLIWRVPCITNGFVLLIVLNGLIFGLVNGFGGLFLVLSRFLLGLQDGLRLVTLRIRRRRVLIAKSVEDIVPLDVGVAR